MQGRLRRLKGVAALQPELKRLGVASNRQQAMRTAYKALFAVYESKGGLSRSPQARSASRNCSFTYPKIKMRCYPYGDCRMDL